MFRGCEQAMNGRASSAVIRTVIVSTILLVVESLCFAAGVVVGGSGFVPATSTLHVTCPFCSESACAHERSESATVIS